MYHACTEETGFANPTRQTPNSQEAATGRSVQVSGMLPVDDASPDLPGLRIL